MNSEFAESFFSLRFRLWLNGRLVSFADVELNDLEVFYITDVIIIVSIYTLEDILSNIRRTSDSQKFIGRIEKSVELIKSHDSLCSLPHFSRFVISLKTHLTTVSFEKEVSKLDERNSSTTVDIKSEDILHYIVDLVLALFLEDINNNLFNSL